MVDDQFGRLTFTDQMAAAAFYALGYREGDVEPSAPIACGTYNLTGSGAVKSWAQIAAKVFELANGNDGAVTPVGTEEYYAKAAGPVARARSILTLTFPRSALLVLSRAIGKSS